MLEKEIMKNFFGEIKKSKTVSLVLGDNPSASMYGAALAMRAIIEENQKKDFVEIVTKNVPEILKVTDEKFVEEKSGELVIYFGKTESGALTVSNKKTSSITDLSGDMSYGLLVWGFMKELDIKLSQRIKDSIFLSLWLGDLVESKGNPSDEVTAVLLKCSLNKPMLLQKICDIDESFIQYIKMNN